MRFTQFTSKLLQHKVCPTLNQYWTTTVLVNGWPFCVGTVRTCRAKS